MNKKGFSIVEITLVVVLVFAVGAAGWYVWDANSTSQTNDQAKTGRIDNNEAETSPDQETKQKTYKSDYLGLAFDYPETWTVRVNENTNNPGTPEAMNTNGDRLLATSPNGFTMFFDQTKKMGLGGSCEYQPVENFELAASLKLGNKNAYVISYSSNGQYYLYVSETNVESAINGGGCEYSGIVQLEELSSTDTPNAVLFGNWVLGEKIVSTQKPQDDEHAQAIEILSSLRVVD